MFLIIVIINTWCFNREIIQLIFYLISHESVISIETHHICFIEYFIS